MARKDVERFIHREPGNIITTAPLGSFQSRDNNLGADSDLEALRRKRARYLRRRRGGLAQEVGFSPGDTTSSSLISWFDFSDIDTIWTDDTRTAHPGDGESIEYVDDKVADWDLTGNGANCVLELDSQNSLSGMKFSASGFISGVRDPGIAMPFTEVLVYSFPGGVGPNSTIQAPRAACPGVGGELFTIYHELSASDNMWFYTEGSLVSRSLDSGANGVHVVTVNWNSTLLELWKDTVSKTITNAAVAARTLTDMTLGINCNGAGASSATFYEMLFYDGELDTSDRNSVEEYLNDKWSVY